MFHPEPHFSGKWAEKCDKWEGKMKHKKEKMKKILKEAIKNLIPEIAQMVDEHKNTLIKSEIQDK
jgi:hypothetical protein